MSAIETHDPSELSPRQAGIIRSHKWALAELPHPDAEPWMLREVPISRGFFDKCNDHQLIEKVTRSKYPQGESIPATWRVKPSVWRRLERLGVVEDGARVEGCGEDGFLPCGSDRFVVEGDRVRCKTCDDDWPKAEVRRS